MSSLGLAARLARREVRRRPGRTALVALLVALPVAGMVMSVALFRTNHLTPDEEWQRDYGNADAVVTLGEPEEAGRTLDALPVDARVVWVSHLPFWARAGDVGSELGITDMPPDDPLSAGILDLREGRVPAAPDEVALTPPVADTFDVEVGDRLTLTRPEVDLQVVGLIQDRADLWSRTAVVIPGGDLITASGHVPSVAGWIDLPDGAVPDELRELDSTLLLRAEAADRYAQPPDRDRVVWTYVIGALVLVVTGIVIAAAFATGVRRQFVTLGQLSASGAPVPVLRAMLVLQGTVTGLVGALAGLGLAVVMLAACRTWVERRFGYRLGTYDVRLLDVAVALGVGVAAATIAALVPAWSLSRVPTLTALAGRRPQPPVRHRVTAAGAVAFTVGLGLLGVAVIGSASGRDGSVWAAVAIAGGVLELLGACAMAPAVVARLEPLAGRTRGSWRLAARSLARQRSRTGGVVSAVAAAAGLAIAATALMAGATAGDTGYPELSDRVVVASEIDSDGVHIDRLPPPDDLLAELQRIVPDAERVTVRAAGESSAWPDSAFAPIVADDALVTALELGDGVRRALEDGNFVTDDAGTSSGQTTAPDGSRRPLVAAESEHLSGGLGVFVSPDQAEDLGVVPQVAGVVLVSDRPLTDEQRAKIEHVRSDWELEHPGAPHLDLSVSWPEPGPTPEQIEMVLTGIAVVFAVLVVCASLALAAAESREERDVLSVAGAGPNVLARTAGARAWLLAAIGAAMAVPVGMLPVAVYAATDDGPTSFVVPWRPIGMLALALPIAVAVLALTASATAQRVRPVRVATAMFD